MLTRSDIHKFLEENGIGRDATVLVHTSMRSLGEVEGGCDGLIDAFTSYLSDGLFIVPTHTWANVGRANPVFDVRTTLPCIGALPSVAAFRADGVRSLHPTHSVAAFGARAEEFVRGEEKATSPATPGGVWSRLLEENAVILLIGVLLNRNTYIHAIDEMIDLPGRLTEPMPLTVIDYTGERHSLLFRKHTDHTGSENFENYREPLEQLGALKNAKLGCAAVGIFNARLGTRIIKSLWERADYDLCASEGKIPEKYYI